jgi:hypothetical protein
MGELMIRMEFFPNISVLYSLREVFLYVTKSMILPVMVVNAYNPTVWKVEAGSS